MIYIIYGIIILITIIIYFLVKDKKEFLKKIGMTTMISGLITLALGLIINISLNAFLNNFNITKIATILLQRFINSSILLLLIGGIEYLLSKLINKKSD